MSAEELFDAIERGDPKPIDAYLDAKKDLNVKNEDGDTPLLYATKLGLSYLVKRFLEHGANPDIRDAEGDTALIIASKNSTIYSTSQYEDPETGGLRLMFGAPPSTYNYPNSQIKTVTYLLKSGANHELKDNSGKTAYYYASRESSGGSSRVESLLYNKYSPLNRKKLSANSHPRVITKAGEKLRKLFENDNENENELPNAAPESSSVAASSSAAASSYAAASTHETNVKTSVNNKISSFKSLRSKKNRKNRYSKKSDTRRKV